MMDEPVRLDEAAEWFDYWIDTLEHADTQLFAARWHRSSRTMKHAIGIQPGQEDRASVADDLGIYDKGILNA